MPRFPNCDGEAPGKVLKVVLEGTNVPPASLLIVIPPGAAEYFLEMYLKWMKIPGRGNTSPHSLLKWLAPNNTLEFA